LFSPAAYEFLTDYGDLIPNWLETDYEILKSVDGSDRPDVAWLYRPRSFSAFLQMCKLDNQSEPLVAACGCADDSAIFDAYRRMNDGGAEGVFSMFGELDRFGSLFFVTAFGHPDLGSSLIAGREAREIVGRILDGSIGTDPSLVAPL